MSRTLFEQVENDFETTEFLERTGTGLSFRQAVDVAVRPKKLKVASYCRVSTEEELQLNSLDNQVIHYTNYIRSNPDWKFAGVYTDKGKSGTRTKSRSGFNKIIQHALDGKIDIIICKSISRFARNVVDTLEAVQLLREKGIRIIFEKEDIDTGNMQSDFILTVLSLTAQEESRNISENITWGNTKRFEMGQPIFVRLIGYTKSDEESWVIVEEEAKVVREAFNQCLAGKTPSQIAKAFIRKGYKKANGRVDWSPIAVRDILKNERYKGDVLCQKTYTKDYLTHEIVTNTGERDQYLLKDNHEPIVDEETFDRVQALIATTKATRKRAPRQTYPLSGRLRCEQCGANFQKFTCRGKVTWRCGNHTKSNLLCTAAGIPEENIKEALIKAFNKNYIINSKASGKQQVIRLARILKDAEKNRETEQNRLRLDLEKALLKENVALINFEDTTKATRKRIKVENKIEESEAWWALFDADDGYRRKAIEKLDQMKYAPVPMVVLKKNMEDLEFLRAWVTHIETVSPSLFSIKWLDKEITKEGDEDK